MPKSRKRRRSNKPRTYGQDKSNSGIHSYWYALGAALMVIVAGVVIWTSSRDDSAHVDVAVPELTGIAARGEGLFGEKCASCHGQNAAGSDKGPPLVHSIYEPGHHADLAFHMAVQRGVRAHHWRFGNMPPVRGINEGEISSIVAYVRALQRANGIR